jgi:16S rRNA A1518/A1519 N6-dimethyltransferase RsmA/KsgA/DIM1 with predicted DNA glycosylase/AP lyase activity
MRLVWLGLFIALGSLWGQEEGKELAPYFPSPRSVIHQMLELAEVKPGEHVFDLGSGDGRIVLYAAKKFKARGTGVELNSTLVERSNRMAQKEKLAEQVNFIQGDFTKQDYAAADVVTLYLLPEANAALKPVLEKTLKKGCRVVAHDFPVPGWKHTRLVNVADDGEGRSHSLYLYVR